MNALPVHAVLSELRAALADAHIAVLEAPPGAGKTTVVPLALLEESWLNGKKIIMLEPRRLAAKNAARFMAQSLGEATGQTVGYRVRHESRVSDRTRIEVVTEGILVRMLQQDPALEDIALVIFDEFHERSLQADLGLALVLDARDNLRDDLGVLVMSATLEGQRVAALLDDAPVVRTEGQQFPVTTRYASMTADDDLALAAARSAIALMREEEGSLLAFFPGAGEIRRAADWLREHGDAHIDITPLFGDLSPAEQDRAIQPAPSGRRKLVLATNIAESSLTIEGVRLVVDAGLERVPVFDPPSGMTRLVTQRISQASADQRRGRAGRNEPGVCLRLWREADTPRMIAHAPPEMLAADLANLALELAGWGISDPAKLRWLDPPPAASFAQACELLTDLGALDASGRITTDGKAMLALPVHPRLAHMLLRGRAQGQGALATILVAILEERDPLAAIRQSDIELRVRAIVSGDGIARGSRQRLLASAKQLAATLGVARELDAHVKSGTLDMTRAGYLIAEAYPDRIARRRPGQDARYQMAGGRGAFLDAGDSLSQQEWLAVATVSGGGRDARIFLAAELRDEDVAALEAEAGEMVQVTFDAPSGAVVARRVRRVGSLVLEEHPVPVPAGLALPALLKGIRSVGLQRLPWGAQTENLRARVETLRRLEPEAWPACNDASLLATLEEWLAPFAANTRKLAEISPGALHEALLYRMGHERARQLDAQAPETFELPSGQRARIDYSGEIPVLAARIQQFFGLHATPAIANGRLPLSLQLLSPANRPMQLTRDLASFWKNTYPEVRKDLRGRYPKHAWPEDPLTAAPRARSLKARGEKE